MRILFIISFLILSLVGCTADSSHTKSLSTSRDRGALSCFSIPSPGAHKAAATNGSVTAWLPGASCEAMCAAQGAVCTATGGYVTPEVCTDIPPDNAVCRCCAEAR